MPKEKAKPEAGEKMHSPPVPDVNRETPDKKEGPMADASANATQLGGPTGSRREHAADALAGADTKSGATGRAVMMKRVQRTLGNARVARMAGEEKQPVEPRPAEHENEVQRQPAGQTGTTETAKAPSYVTEDLKQKMAATILAESFAGQESDIRWMYYNRITTEKGEEGLKGSAAYKGKSTWYRIWLFMLGDSTYGEKAVPKTKEFKGFSNVKEFCEKNEYMTKIAAPRAEKVKKLIDETFDKPTTNPYPGWTGQGNLDDFNNISKPKSSYWKMARAYYWLQKEGTVKDIFVKILPAGDNTQVVFDGVSIERYYKTHTLPKEVPLYTPSK